MKIFSLILILFGLINITCTSSVQETKNITQQNNLKRIEKIELIEQTRGTNRKITFTEKNLRTSVNNETTDSQINFSQWLIILKEINKIDISKVSTFQSKSTGRFSDRAFSSKIIIFSKENSYESSIFDSGNPPLELKNLYEELQRIIETKKSK